MGRPVSDPISAPASRRRFLQLIGAGAALPAVTGVAGCGQSSGGALGGGSGGGKVTELIVPTAKSPWLDAYRTVAATYREKSGISVTLREFPYDGLFTQQTNAVRSGNFPFDVFQVDEFGVDQFFANRWVQPLNDIGPSFRFDPQVVTYADLPFWDASSKSHRGGGQTMSYPINGNLDLFVYRKDIYEDLGLSVPKTWQEAADNAAKIKGSGKIRYGSVLRTQATTSGLSCTYEFMPVFYSYGGAWFEADDSGKLTPTVDTPAAIDAATMFRRFAELGPAETETIGQAEVISLMQGGQAAQTWVVAAAAAQFLDKDKSQIADTVGFAEVPAGSTGRAAPTSGTWSLCIPAGLPAERATAALDFITWMESKETQTAFVAAGGIPTRKDVLNAAAKSGPASSYLAPLRDSIADVRPSVRYTFGAEMAAATETTISQIAAGAVSPKAGMSRLQTTLEQIVQKAGRGK